MNQSHARSSNSSEIHIVGAGPAGAILALRAHQRGLTPHLYDPKGIAPWPATYGIIDSPDLPQWALPFFGPAQSLTAHAETKHELPFKYRMLNNESLAEAAAEVSVIHEQSVDPADLAVQLHQRTIDCRGAITQNALWQVAVGFVLPAQHEPLFMDWRPIGELPSFLYVQPHPFGTLFEETILATAQDMNDPFARADLFARLETQLQSRLSTLLPCPTTPPLATEHVCIPMGTVGVTHPNVINFGARSGFINPATGYSVASSSMEVDRCLDAWEQGKHFRIPASGRLAHVLRNVGGELIARADHETLRNFFRCFFLLPPERQLAYLQADDGLAVARSMWALRKQTGYRHAFLRPLWRRPLRVIYPALRRSFPQA